MTSEADSIEWLDLDAGEKIRWTGQPSVYPVVPFLVIGVGIAVFGAFLAALLTGPSSPFRFVLIGLFIGLGLFVAGWRSAEQRSVAYAITTDAVYEKQGMSAAPDVSTIPLADIESTSEERSTLAGLAGRGTVRIYAPTADRTTLALDGIGTPGEVRALLSGRAERADTSSGVADIDTGTETTEADAGRTATDPEPIGASSGIAGSDADTPGPAVVTDGEETNGESLRAYVVDVAEDAVLLRAFTDTSTDADIDAIDLERGHAVSLTVRPEREPDSGSESDSDADRRSALDSTLDRVSTTSTDSPAPPETSESRRSDRAEGDDRAGAAGKSDDTDPDDQFVWGDASDDTNGKRHSTSDTATDASPSGSGLEDDSDD